MRLNPLAIIWREHAAGNQIVSNGDFSIHIPNSMEGQVKLAMYFQPMMCLFYDAGRFGCFDACGWRFPICIQEHGVLNLAIVPGNSSLALSRI